MNIQSIMNEFGKKGLRYLVLSIVCAICIPLSAQTSCDKLFSSGVKFQQTMTIASQNKAITYFEKAKVCYDSQAKKDLCDQQITTCRNIIVQLSKRAKTEPVASVPKQDVDSSPSKTLKPDNKQEKRDIQLDVDVPYLKFKGKGGEFKKAKITCNYPDWSIAEKPDWVNCSQNNGEIVVEAKKNPNKEERSGSIIIKCGEKSVTLTVIQEKFKKYGII